MSFGSTHCTDQVNCASVSVPVSVLGTSPHIPGPSCSNSTYTACFAGAVYFGRARLVHIPRPPRPPTYFAAAMAGYMESCIDGDRTWGKARIDKGKGKCEVDTDIRTGEFNSKSSIRVVPAVIRNRAMLINKGISTITTIHETDSPDVAASKPKYNPATVPATATASEMADKLAILIRDLKELRASCTAFDEGTLGMLENEERGGIGVVNESMVEKLLLGVKERGKLVFRGYEEVMGGFGRV